MRKHFFFHPFLLACAFCYPLFNSTLISIEKVFDNDDAAVLPSPFISEDLTASKDAYIHALASLIFYLHQEEKTLEERSHSFETINFTDADLSNLWNKVNEGILIYSHKKEKQSLFKEAYDLYIKGNREIQNGLMTEALNSLENAENKLKKLLDKAIEEEEISANENEDSQKIQEPIKDPNIKNPLIQKKVRRAMKPYLLSQTHPMRNTLDAIFQNNRATVDEETFLKEGFQTIATGSRSYIVVATHEKLPGYLVKVYLDNELNKKSDKESWDWLVRRCQGAKQIRDIIKRRNIKYFVVPDKWLYCLPPKPSPFTTPLHTHHFAILLVTDMELAPKRRNYNVWYDDITKEHLKELYLIISRAKGSSYRPDNIAYTKNDQFAFIDTEYPNRGPDYLSIRHFLNPEMCDYWDKLVTNGGF